MTISAAIALKVETVSWITTTKVAWWRMGRGIKRTIADNTCNLCQMHQNHLPGQKDLSLSGVAYNCFEDIELTQAEAPDCLGKEC